MSEKKRVRTQVNLGAVEGSPTAQLLQWMIECFGEKNLKTPFLNAAIAFYRPQMLADSGASYTEIEKANRRAQMLLDSQKALALESCHGPESALTLSSSAIEDDDFPVVDIDDEDY
ncbi:MAG: hypothetical protein ACRCYP_04490 [Alphaproteobacteria bacterium]